LVLFFHAVTYFPCFLHQDCISRDKTLKEREREREKERRRAFFFVKIATKFTIFLGVVYKLT